MLDALSDGRPGLSISLVLAGGAALGAYEAGAYEALHAEDGPLPDWVAGSSIGAVNAAVIAGNPPGRRVERLREFWNAAAPSITKSGTKHHVLRKVATPACPGMPPRRLA